MRPITCCLFLVRRCYLENRKRRSSELQGRERSFYTQTEGLLEKTMHLSCTCREEQETVLKDRREKLLSVKQQVECVTCRAEDQRGKSATTNTLSHSDTSDTLVSENILTLRRQLLSFGAESDFVNMSAGSWSVGR